MNSWGHRFSQNGNQKFEGFLPYLLINFQCIHFEFKWPLGTRLFLTLVFGKVDLSYEFCFSSNLSDLSLFAPSIMSIKLSNPRYVMEPACYVFYLYIEEKTLIKFYKTKKLTYVREGFWSIFLKSIRQPHMTPSFELNWA